MESTTNIITKYILLLNEYMQHMVKSELLKNINNSDYIIFVGLHSIIHIFKISFINTNNINTTYYNCQKGYFCYLEYIEQINKSNLIHSLNIIDSITFIYKNSLNDIFCNQQNLVGLDKTESYTVISNPIPPPHTQNNIQFDTNPTEIIPGDFVESSKKTESKANPESFAKTLNELVTNISFITTHILFFKSEFNIELGEPTISHKSQFSNQILFILNNHLTYYLLLLNTIEIHEKNIHSFLRLIEYIEKCKNILNLDFEEYGFYLKYIHKILKKNFILPFENTINDTYFTLFFIEENRLYIEKMKNEKKMNLVCKALLEFEFT